MVKYFELRQPLNPTATVTAAAAALFKDFVSPALLATAVTATVIIAATRAVS